MNDKQIPADMIEKAARQLFVVWVDSTTQCALTWDDLGTATKASWLAEARAVLAAALDGCEVREEWIVTGLPGEPFPPYRHTWADGEAAQEFVAKVRDRGVVAYSSAWYSGPDLTHRLVIITPAEDIPGGDRREDTMSESISGDEDPQSAYDSRPETFKHSQRVGELILQLVKELLDRSTCHDRSKTEPPELVIFNEFTPKLKDTTYGSDEYRGYLDAMGAGLRHHYAYNRHHPEHYSNGVAGMTLVDLVEMLADWKAATERHDDGSLATSLDIQQNRFGIAAQLTQILWNTASEMGWLDADAMARGWPQETGAAEEG